MTAPRRALVVVDAQQDYVDGPLQIQHPPHAESVPLVLRVLDAAADAQLPVAVFQHDSGEGSPVFDPTRPGFRLHPDVEARRRDTWKCVVKRYSSVFAGTDLLPWLREHDVDTVALVGFASNNCVLASAVEAEGLGVAVEVLRDATGAIHLSNDAGTVDAASLHSTLMALLHSNFATVTDVDAWTAAVAAGQRLTGDDLVSSATPRGGRRCGAGRPVSAGHAPDDRTAEPVSDRAADPAAGAVSALEAPQVSVRLRAAMALGTWPDLAHLEAVVRRSAVEPDPFVRDTLAWVLTRLPAGPVLARLRPELDDPRPQARAQALHALSKVLDRSARPWVTPELLADPDDVVARTAWRSALALTPREDLEEDRDVDPAAAAERAQLAELLAGQLGRGDEELQRSLSRVLVQLGPAAEAVLERAAGSPRPEVVAHAEAAGQLQREHEEALRRSTRSN